MVNLLAAATGAELADPIITLKNYLSGVNWTGTPAASSIRFDTKFDKMDAKENQIIIKNMTTVQPPECLGVSRYRYVHAVKIHVWCQGKSARNNKYLLQREIERIIKTAPLGMFADGIEMAMLDDFTEIETGQPESVLNKGIAVDDRDIARSAATCKLYYSKVVT